MVRRTGDVILLVDKDQSTSSHWVLISADNPGAKPCDVYASDLCDHEIYRFSVLALETDGQDFVLITCNWCQDIKLFRLQGEQSSMVGQSVLGHSVVCMAQGEPGVVYISTNDRSSISACVFELKYSSSGFEKTYQIIDSDIHFQMSSLCYLPAPHRAILCGFDEFSGNRTRIEAISTATHDNLWSSEGEVRYHILPHLQVLYVPQNDVILVNDDKTMRFVVLNPRDGSHLRTVQLMADRSVPLENRDVEEVNIHNNKMVVLYSKRTKDDTNVYLGKFTMDLSN